MYTYAKGHTFESTMTAIKRGNNNTKATNATRCLYLTPDGNKCFIGCFIPEGYEAQKSMDDVEIMLNRFPEVKEFLPLKELRGIKAFQDVHDIHDARDNADLYTRAERWLEQNVKEAP
jgi:hypothetical protein